MKKILSIFIAVICILQMETVYAAEQETSVVISVQQMIGEEDTKSSWNNKKFQYQLSAVEEESPLPDSAEAGIYSFTIEGSRKIELEPIKYRREGIFEYTIKQVAENAGKYKQDETVYKITVYIQKRQDGSLESQLVESNSEGEKVAAIIYRNTYIGEKTVIGKDNIYPLGKGASAAKTKDLSSPEIYWGMGIAALGVIVRLKIKKR